MKTPIQQSQTTPDLQTMDRLSQSLKNRLAARDIDLSLTIKENELLHGTWRLEQQILSYIREGNTEGIHHLFLQLSRQTPPAAGTVADTPLRQEKNLFIGLVALVGKTAGIEGGIDVEDAYRMMDLYTQECEKAMSTEEVQLLRYHMLLDFTERVRQAKLPANLSSETIRAIHYIHSRIYGPITIDDIASYVGVSRAALTRKFRSEMGQSLMNYASSIKIREAQRLLLYSDLSISAIADYLNYSSQPHFQTVFRKACGITPMEYRTANRKISL